MKLSFSRFVLVAVAATTMTMFEPTMGTIVTTHGGGGSGEGMVGTATVTSHPADGMATVTTHGGGGVGAGMATVTTHGGGGVGAGMASGERRDPCAGNPCKDGATCRVENGYAVCDCPNGGPTVRPKYSCPPPPEVKPAAPFVHAAMGNPEENAAMTKDIPRPPPPPGDDDPCIPNRCDMDVKCTVGEGLPRCHCPSGKLVPPMISCETGQELSPPPPPPPPVSSESEAYGGMAGDVPPSGEHRANPCEKHDCRDGSTCTVNEFGFADCHCPDGITVVRPKYSCPAPPKASAYVHAAMGNPEENAAVTKDVPRPPPPPPKEHEDPCANNGHCIEFTQCFVGEYGYPMCQCPDSEEVVRPKYHCTQGENGGRQLLRGATAA